MKAIFHVLTILSFLSKMKAGNGFLVGLRLKAVPTALKVSAEMGEAERLLEQAQRLKEEATQMEVKLRRERGSGVVAAAPDPIEKPVKYQEVPGSVWAIKYRFATEPVKDRDEDAEPLQFYRGTVQIMFRPDGYSEVVAEDGADNGGLKILKVWGWDEELSQEDGKRYVLFSIDAKTPTTQKQRFYFQALLENKESNAISLSEGTVTIKQDLAETKKAMRFGFFSSAGILAQFRYVGEFSAKAIKID